MNTLKMKSLSRVRLFATPWTVAYQAPPSMGFSRQECWSGLPFPTNPQGRSVSLMSRVTPDLLKLDQPLSRCKDPRLLWLRFSHSGLTGWVDGPCGNSSEESSGMDPIQASQYNMKTNKQELSNQPTFQMTI